MTSKLIKLADETLVEVEVPGDYAQEISGSMASKVDNSINSIQSSLLKVCNPIVNAWKELNKQAVVSETEVEIGFGFEGEGNIYLAKAKTNAHITVKFKLVPAQHS